MRTVLALVALACVLSAAVATASATPPRTELTLDGVGIQPELALTDDARARGLMHRRRAPADGMLFVFPQNTTGGFWMKNTLVPLKIVFFSAEGRQVRRMFMTPCRSGDCRIYNPLRMYRFALELPASDRRPARRLGPLRELRRLTRLAS